MKKILKIVIGSLAFVALYVAIIVTNYLFIKENKVIASEPSTVYLRDFDSNKNCRVTNATNATPIVITCAAAHHLSDNDLVQLVNVSGNTNANGLRYIDVLTSTTFALYSASGPTTPVAGNGSWNNGTLGDWSGGPQIAGKVTAYTTSSHPRLLINQNSGGNFVRFAAAVHNNLLVSIVDSGNSATATYSTNHGLSVGDKVCVYSAGDADLNCSSTPDANTYFTISSKTNTTITFTTSNVTDGTYNNSNLTVSSWAQGSNISWLGINTGRSFLESSYTLPAVSYRKNRSHNFALICYINRSDTTACNVAKQAILDAENMATNFACDETAGNCNDAKGDYLSYYFAEISRIFTLVRWNLTEGQISTFASKMLNDLNDPVLGTSCTQLDRSNNLTGTMSGGNGVDHGQTFTITGVGTQFLSELQPGSVIVKPNGNNLGELEFTYISSVSDNTHAVGNGDTLTGATTYAVVPPWSANDCGAVWYLKHHLGTFGGQPVTYPPNGGSGTYGVSPLSNMTISKVTALMGIGIALADDDERARSLVSNMSVYFADYVWPLVSGYWTGFSGNGSNYHYGRTSHQIVDTIAGLKNSFVSGPDLTSSDFLPGLGSHLRFMWAPASTPSAPVGIWGWGADSGTSMFEWSGGRADSFTGDISLNPSSIEASKTAYWLRNVFGLSAAQIGSISGFYSANFFSRFDPNVSSTDYTSDPTQKIWRNNNLTACNAPGTVTCPDAGSQGFSMIISRNGWTSSSDTAVGYESGAYYTDHALQRAGDYVINKGGKFMVGRDHDEAGASAGSVQNGQGNMYTLSNLSINDGEYSTANGISLVRNYTPKVLRWAGGDNDDGRTDSAFAYWLNDLTSTWQSGMNFQYRQGLHLKSSGKTEHFLLYDSLKANSGNTIKFYTHFLQNGEEVDNEVVEGSTSCPDGATCAQINTSRQVNTTSLNNTYYTVTKYITPTGVNTFMSVDNGNGTYSGGLGNSYRVTACAGSGSCSSSATDYEMITVHKVGSGASTSITASALNPSSSWTGVELSDWTVLFARGTSTPSSVPAFTTGATTNIVVAGITPGNYKFTRNGSDISGCTGLTSSSGDLTVYCEDVPAGSIAIVDNGEAPDSQAPTIGSVSASSITTSGATITWTTNENANSNVQHGLTTSYGSASSTSSLGTSHSITLTGLSPSTIYHYSVYSVDSSGNSATSSDATFTTATPDNQAPTISSVSSGSLTISGATITWTTNENANSNVQYGLTTSYGSAASVSSFSTGHSVALTGLSSNTTYHYRVYSVDTSGNSATSSDGTFTTRNNQNVEGWYNIEWGHRKPITIDATKVSQVSSTTLSNFPLLVSFTNNDLRSTGNGGLVAGNGGADILFTNGSSTVKFSHQIEYYDDATGEIKAWVKLPSLSNATNTIVYMYFGNSEATDQQDSEAVWDSNYKLVAHLSDGTTLDTTDSTSNGNNLTNSGGATATTGMIDGGLNLSGSSQYLTKTSFTWADASPVTVSYWQNKSNADVISDGGAGAFGVIAESNKFGNHSPYSDGTFYWDYGNTAGNGRLSTSFAGLYDKWTYVSLTSGGGTGGMKIYLDGVERSSSENSDSPSGLSTLNIGLYNTHFKGKLDEFRLSNVVRSADWISTEYNNQYSTSTFFQISATEEPDTSDSQAPTIGSVSASSITTSRATITWTTDESANSNVEYGLTTSYGTASSTSSINTSHSIVITGLTAGTVYHYRVYSADATGNSATSSDYTFTTDTEEEEENIAPTMYAGNNVSLDLSSVTSVTLLATASDDGLPSATLNYSWTDDGTNPASVSFSSRSVLNPIVTFTTQGVYKFHLAVSDTELSSTDYTFVYASGTIPVIIPVASDGVQNGTSGGGRRSNIDLVNIPVVTQPIQNQSILGAKSISSNLWKGVKGGEVLILQDLLIKRGLLSADDRTGYYGYNTETAVKKLQKENGIVSSGDQISTGYGVVGPATKKLINNLLKSYNSNESIKPSVSAPVQNNSSGISSNLWRGVKGGEVLILQDLLIKRGLLSADDRTGYYGYNTETAVKKLQKENGIVSSGDQISTGYGVVGPATKKLINNLLKN